jgi:uncharacterized protein YndB with AHSA1/START domain
MKNSLILLTGMLMCVARSPAIAAPPEVANTSYVTAAGEKVLRLDLVVPIDRAEAWKLIATQEGLRKWIAPVAEIDLRVGGQILTHYDKTKSVRDPGAIRLGIVNYLEGELIVLKVKLNANFSEKAQREDEGLQEIIQLVDLGAGRTRIRASMMGWGAGPEWEKVYRFFEAGNTWTFKVMAENFPGTK